MTHYQTEEQQLEDIKDFFKQHKRIIMVVVVGLILFISGYRYWQLQIAKSQTGASIAYESLMQAASRHEEKNIQAFADRLNHTYPHTIYAQAGGLVLAKLFVQNAQVDKAKHVLMTVMNSDAMPAIKQIARMRLARILMQDKEYIEALNTLKVRVDKNYDSLLLALEGDIYFMQRQFKKANEAYERALAAGKQNDVAKHILDIKLSNNRY